MLRPAWHVEPWEIDFDRRDRAGRGGAGPERPRKNERMAFPGNGGTAGFVVVPSKGRRIHMCSWLLFELVPFLGCVGKEGRDTTMLGNPYL